MATIAVIAVGEMGACLATSLRAAGARVVTSVEGRSQATRRRADAAGAESLSLAEAVTAADVFLSVLPPARALDLAEQVATHITDPLVYVDANAVSPRTALGVRELVEAAGARFVDGGIIGVPPRPRLYLSGPAAPDAGRLLAGLEVRDLGGPPGRASALKMCYAAFTKGTTALATELLLAARRLDVAEELEAELRSSASALLDIAERSVPRMPGKAHRWIAEMEEIAATFESAGLTPLMLQGAAEMYRLVEAAGGRQAEAPTLAETLARLEGER